MKGSTLKKELISLIEFSCSENQPLEGEQVILLTASGIIRGYPMLNDEESDKNLSFLEGATQAVSKRLRQENEIQDEEALPNNDGCILLRDAYVELPGSISTFGQIAIFFDQIIGVTFGKKKP